MAKVIDMKDVTDILKKIQKSKSRTGRQIGIGLKTAGLLLQRLSQEIVPTDLGNLKGSAGTKAIGKGFDTAVSVFYLLIAFRLRRL